MQREDRKSTDRVNIGSVIVLHVDRIIRTPSWKWSITLSCARWTLAEHVFSVGSISSRKWLAFPGGLFSRSFKGVNAFRREKKCTFFFLSSREKIWPLSFPVRACMSHVIWLKCEWDLIAMLMPMQLYSPVHAKKSEQQKREKKERHFRSLYESFFFLVSITSDNARANRIVVSHRQRVQTNLSMQFDYRVAISSITDEEEIPSSSCNE